MRIAVTGATGHVGLNLIERLLDDGHQVRAFAQAGFEPLEGSPVERRLGDVRDEGALRDCFRGVDVVFHLAAVISIDGDRGGLVYDVNVGGSRAAANAAVQAGVRRFVHFSSVHAFDMHSVTGVVDESSPRSVGERCAAYDRSKALGEAAVRDAIGRGLDAVIVHPAGVLGPVDRGVSRAGKGLLDAARGRLPVMVNGGFDFVDVRDVVAGACAASERGKQGRSYILSGSHRSMEELVTLAARRAGMPPPLITLPRWLLESFAGLPTLIGRLRGKEPLFTTESLKTLGTGARFSHRRAADELGYRPRPAEETVADLVDWFIAMGWVKRRGSRAADPATDVPLTPFVRHLHAHPLDGATEREILALLLAEIALVDGAVEASEQALLRQFIEVGAEEPPVRPVPTPLELRALTSGTRESLLLVAIALACVDEDYSAIERDAIERLRERLGISSNRSDELLHWAKEFVIDQRFDEFFADGVLDPEERKRIEQMATGLDLSPATISNAEARARQRRGLPGQEPG